MTIARISLFVAAFSLIAWPAVSAAEDAAEANVDDRVIEWLDRLEERGEQIETLTGSVSYTREDELLGERQIRLGKLAYAAADAEEDEPARFAVHFDQLVIDDALREQDRAYIFDGEWLVEKQADRRLFHKRQVVPPGQRYDPLRVDGPFPLPIGQERDDVLARFDVTLLESPDPDDYPGSEALDTEQYVHLRLTPREDAPRGGHEAEFDRVDMAFDRETLLPHRVHTREGRNSTTVLLYDHEVDALDPQQLAERFDTTAPDSGEGWRVEITPYDEQ